MSRLPLGCLLLAAVIMVIAPQPATAGSSDIDAQFEMKPGKELRLDLDRLRGRIQIEGWDKDRVEVTGRVDGRDLRDDDEILVEKSSSGVDISPGFRPGRNERIDVDLKINVPSKFDVRVRAAADTRIRNVSGTIDASLANADLELENVRGEGEVSTANGKLSMKNCELNGEVSSVNGGLRLDDSDVSGEVSVVNGGIRVSRASQGLDVSSTNGSVDIGSAKDHVRAEMVNGSIEIAELEGWLEAETVNGTVKLRMVGSPEGRRGVDIETLNGDVELEIPENFSMQFDIEVKSEDRGSYYEIISDFDLDIEENSSRRHQKMSGKGKIGDGRNKVHIRARNGDVILKRASS